VRIAALATLLLTACYESHLRRVDAGQDAGPIDAGTDAAVGPCITTCEAPRVLTASSLTEMPLGPAAVLDLTPTDSGLVGLMIASDYDATSMDYRLFRVPWAGGAAEVAASRALDAHPAISAGSVRSSGSEIRAVVLRTDARPSSSGPQQTFVDVATWTDFDDEPVLGSVALHETPFEVCGSCPRYGAAIVQDDAHAVAGLAADGNIYVARIAFADLSVERWILPIAGGSADAPMGGAGDGRGRALLTAGGSRGTFGGSVAGPAFGVTVEESIGPPVSVPGDRFDPPPFAVMFEDATDLFRFQHDGGGVSGAVHRYRLGADGLVELATIDTAAGLEPYALAATHRAVLWAEPDLSLPGAANLRVLVHGSWCTSEEPVTAAHLPFPLIDGHPTVLAATEHDGRTYAATLERRGMEDERLVVVDLGACEAR
jgi:hypothetical protein